MTVANPETWPALSHSPLSLPKPFYHVDPVADPRWQAFVACHPLSSVYHTHGWLKALQQTYGFQPIAYTTTPPGGELRNGVVFCQIQSWITGPRLVSLPFSDHCDILADTDDEAESLIARLLPAFQKQGWGHTELRPRRTLAHVPRGLRPNKHYCFHALDLSSEEKVLFTAFHKDCIQRKIKRAEKEGLEYRVGRSPELLAMFYAMFVKMRQKHGLPPQPRKWFQNLVETPGLGIQVRVALHLGRPAASIITISHRGTMIYKYGCSNPELNRLGAMPWLFWRIIRDARAAGFGELDLGRSEWKNPGLITFKDRLGATRKPVTYWRCPQPKGVTDALSDGGAQWITSAIFSYTPVTVLEALGRWLYPHIG